MVSGFDYILNKCFASEVYKLCLALSVLCGSKTIPYRCPKVYRRIPPSFRQLRILQIKAVPFSFVLRFECATNPRLSARSSTDRKAWETHELPWPLSQGKKHYFSKSRKKNQYEEKNNFDKYYDSRGHDGFLFLH
ncbi:MAG: hypothetical protein DRJ05_19445 [Bacteroidetes bacterium]|nr:MAG: hypothetical protein DRJ05_19445 [Bacteroidota bacterium]